ncbi:MAG: DUF3280 domain-containing protein [Alphaproteobacteria bacterium]|nr:DUF3280 domain-containing protein [Alphaproteobacteria bacterium]MBV9200239.1 DUF3280 domain-containing protein [Alphaproteobacteria bacterium]MBV9374269.1 DUF3280 domain-containing protein [Alphaproteobacteria bacterium]MBV9815230.1 DUF3280 domain-containing protein [Alphaproteobacteria bacterium]
MYRITAAALVLLLVAAIAARAMDVPKVAFFGFQLINTSLEPEGPAEAHRIAMLDELLRERLDNSGRFRLVPIPPDIAQKIAGGPEISACNGCERSYAKTVGAGWAAWGTVQKVSNLILNINLYMEDAETGQLEFVKSVDIRSNTDESWWHGLDYMLRHYLFGEP